MLKTYFAPVRALALATMLVVPACSDLGDPVDPGNGNGSNPVSFSRDVQPIFNASCALPTCHAGSNPTGEMNLESGNSYASIVGVVSDGYAPALRVVAGDPDESVLYNRVADTGRFDGRMPPLGPALSSGAVDIIRTWIAEGAADN